MKEKDEKKKEYVSPSFVGVMPFSELHLFCTSMSMDPNSTEEDWNEQEIDGEWEI